MEVVTVNVGVTVAEVTGVPFSTMEFTRSRSKLRNVGVVPMVILAKVTFTVLLVRVAGIFVGTPAALITTTSASETVNVAPLYVPGGMFAAVNGSSVPA